MWFFKKQPEPAPLNNYKLYTNCEELPLHLFRKCLEGGDLNPLVIEGTPPVAVVADAWAGIYSQYIDLSGDNDVKAMAFLKREYVLLHGKISQTELAVNILEAKIYAPEQYNRLVEIITGAGFEFSAEETDAEAFAKAIRRTRNRIAPLRLKLATLEKELAAYETDTENNALPENYFISWLVCLQKYGYRDFTTANKTLTVAEFVLAIRDYLRYVSEHNKALDYGKEKHD